jgi:hypothetical protein
MLRLALAGDRVAGSAAQACLREADAHLRRLQLRPIFEETEDLPQLRLSCLQLQRALETVLWHTERLTDDRMSHLKVHDLPGYAARVLSELYALIDDGIAALRKRLHEQNSADPDEARAREIEINVRQVELRQHLSTTTTVDAQALGMMAVVDALEATGNQLFRMSEACTTSALPDATHPHGRELYTQSGRT